MFDVVRFIRERKKLVFLCALVYLVSQFVYTGGWQLRTVISKPAAVGSMLVQMWNTRELFPAEVNTLVKDIRIERATAFSGAERRLKTFSDREKPLIAVGCGITSKKLPAINDKRDLASAFQFFSTLLETFCKTADRVRFNYVFYVAHDSVDPFFSNQSLVDDFRRTFDVEARRLCGVGTGGEGSPQSGHPTPALVTSLHLVACSSDGKPTRAQNDAMVAAYVDGADFFYRVNDDTKMVTGDWARQFVAVLEGFDPPRVGVVGPNHSGGNVGILTYDFVHRTHVDILGFYYPYLFTDWWGDDWMTRVYKPNHSTKLHNIRLAHTMTLGRRYSVNYAVERQVGNRLTVDKITIDRYVAALKAGKFARQRSGRKVISMSLYGSEQRYTWGAIRNAQLLPVYLPDWTLRVYVPDSLSPATTNFRSSSSSPFLNLTVQPAVVETLRWLGAEIAWVPENVSADSHLSPRDWRLLAADDSDIDFLLIRDADHRLSDRESTSIDEWIAAAESSGSDDGAAIHCFRDHPKHADRALTDGLLGVRPAALRRRLGKGVTTVFANSVDRGRGNETAGNVVLNDVVWPAMKDTAFCHDSVSVCGMWSPHSSRHAFPSTVGTGTSQRQQLYVGQKFDAHETPLNSDWKDLAKSDVICDEAAQLLQTAMQTNAISTSKIIAAAAAAAAVLPLSSTAPTTTVKSNR